MEEEERWGYRGRRIVVCAFTVGGGDSLVHTLASFPAEFLFRGYRREATKTKG